MSHIGSHGVCHNVTPRGRNAGRTIGVTLLQTRPDQTVVTGVCCSSVVKVQNQVTVTYGDWTWR